MKVRPLVVVSLATLAAAVLGGCGADRDSEGGGPLPHQFDGESYPAPRFQATGEVVQTENGCLFVTVDGVRRYAVWPREAEQDRDDATLVRLADGTRVAAGNRIAVTAAVFPVASLPGVPDGFWGNYTGYCAPGDKDVIVLDTVEVLE
jgi:hypothetical protein